MLKASIFGLITFMLCVVINSDELPSVCPIIKTRSEWGGSPSKAIEYQTFPVQNVIIHHTVTPTCSNFQECSRKVRSIQNYHMNEKGWSDIAYNFLIGNDGVVYEGIGWHKVGSHTRTYNNKSIGIAFIGNYDHELPSIEALDAAECLLSCGVELGELNRRYRLLAARQVANTVSPGLMLYNEIQEWDNWVAVP